MRLQYKDVQGAIKESFSTFLLQRDQRERLVAKRLCTLRRPSRKLLLQRAREKLAVAVADKVVLFWVDNFNRVHYRNRPLKREGHVNGTAVAVVPALDALPRGWKGHCSLEMLVRLVSDAAAALRRLEGDFAYELQNKVGLLNPDNIRVPCDLRRVGVQSADWYPYDIQAKNISCSEGLVEVLAYVKGAAAQLKALASPVMCDVNIYWRIQRLMFSESYVHLDVHSALHRVPVVFGVWHCYVHCIRRVWATFRSWWMPVEYPELLGPHPESAKCYDFPALIQLEHTVLALAVHGPALKGPIAAAIAELKADASIDFDRKNHRLMLLEMLHLFLVEYVPTLFQFGVEVRHCYWLSRDRWTGANVKPLLGKYIVFLSKLSWDSPSAFEYCRSALLAYLSWSDLHDQLPASYHVEECLEASLSRLAAVSNHAHHYDQEADLAMLYCATCKASTAQKDLVKPGVSKVFLKAVADALPNLLAACKAGTLPHVPHSSPGHRSKGSPRWPTQPISIPLRLFVSEGSLDYSALLLRSLKLVSSPLSRSSKPDEIGYILDVKLCSPSGLAPLGTQARQLRMLAAQKIATLLKSLEPSRPKKKAKPAAPAPAAAQPAAPPAPAAVDPEPEVDVMEDPDFQAPPPAPAVDPDEPRRWGDVDHDMESVQSEDSRGLSEFSDDLDEYEVPYIDDLEVDPLALV